MHWGDAFVKDLTGKQLVSTGISPSGPIHVGNMREILTGDIIYKSALKADLDARFIYLCDDMDPLRKVYPFLTKAYINHIGKPLSSIPAPEGEGIYSEFFLKPLLDTLEVINVKVDVIKTTNLYKEGVFERAIDIVINKRNAIMRIIEELSQRKVGEDWYPYNPKCSECGRLNTTSVVSYKHPYVEYDCKCGHKGFSDIRKDEGKMPWRIEWPAKWYTLGVTIEPFGKDHGTPGGSYDTGKRIVEEVFGTKAPKPLTYERIFLKGMGVMHSSTGIAIPASDVIQFAPPQIIRFLVARANPSRHIDFDPALGLLNLIDEYEKYEKAYFGMDTVSDEDYRRVYELSSVTDDFTKPDKISFRHLVTLVQIYRNEDDLLKALARGGYEEAELSDRLLTEITIVKNWLDRYAPDSVKFELMGKDEEVDISDKEKEVISTFVSKMNDIKWDASEIHNLVHNIAKEMGIKPQESFSAFYKVMIDKNRGPRLGYFLSNLEKEFVNDRLSFVIKE